MRKSLLAATTLLAATAFAAEMLPAGVKTEKSASGASVLADAKGMTLYTFDKDTTGKSVCNGRCANNWAPLLATGTDTMAMGDWTIVTRDDGTKQWAYKGKPLYTWIKDTQPGQTTGDGVGKVWHTATP